MRQRARQPISRRIGRVAAMILIVSAVIVSMAGPAWAHTEFSSSDPEDGQVLDSPVSEIRLTFAGVAEPAGDGFLILDAEGTLRAPDAVLSDDNLIWRLIFDEPLAGGTVGVRWRVAAPDAHPIDGSFSFSVSAQPTKATELPSATTTTVAATSDGAVVDEDLPDELSQTDDTDAVGQVESSTPAAVALDEFLDTTESGAPLAGALGVAGRLSTLFGAMIGLGGLVFAALVLRGEPSDIKSVLFWTRRAAVLLGIGALVELFAQVASSGGAWSSLLSPTDIIDVLVSSFGLAITLRLVGAAVLGKGARFDVRHAHTVADPVASMKEFATVGIARSMVGAPQAEDPVPTGLDHLNEDDDHVWYARTGLTAFVGAGLVLISFLFDGHTASEGPRALHAVANMIHVGAGAIWAGGVLMLVHVITRRHRRGADLRALQLAVRFSVIAAISLAFAAAAGTALTIIILDSVSELWATPWGRFLMAKVVVVAAAATAGGYNHKVLIPLMERNPDDESRGHQFRSAVTAEAIALMLVIAVTALLVGAAS